MGSSYSGPRAPAPQGALAIAPMSDSSRERKKKSGPGQARKLTGTAGRADRDGGSDQRRRNL